MTDAPKGSLGFSGHTDQAGSIISDHHTVIILISLTPLKLTTFKKVVNRSDLQDALHVFMQDANFRLPIRVDDKLCGNRNIGSFIKSSVCAAHEHVNPDTEAWPTRLLRPHLSWWERPGPTA